MIHVRQVFCMVKNDERFFFIIELGRLLDEYHKCPYEAVKKSIYEDIVLLRHAIGLIQTICLLAPLKSHLKHNRLRNTLMLPFLQNCFSNLLIFLRKGCLHGKNESVSHTCLCPSAPYYFDPPRTIDAVCQTKWHEPPGNDPPKPIIGQTDLWIPAGHARTKQGRLIPWLIPSIRHFL